MTRQLFHNDQHHGGSLDQPIYALHANLMMIGFPVMILVGVNVVTWFESKKNWWWIWLHATVMTLATLFALNGFFIALFMHPKMEKGSLFNHLFNDLEAHSLLGVVLIPLMVLNWALGPLFYNLDKKVFAKTRNITKAFHKFNGRMILLLASINGLLGLTRNMYPKGHMKPVAKALLAIYLIWAAIWLSLYIGPMIKSRFLKKKKEKKSKKIFTIQTDLEIEDSNYTHHFIPKTSFILKVVTSSLSFFGIVLTVLVMLLGKFMTESTEKHST